MNAKIEKFRHELNRVFDDNLHTKQWHNYVDYAIIGLIVISTVEVFLSTYDGIVEKYSKWLHFVDYFTTIFFTIEVTLRIWCADLLDEKYKGFWGRVKYCFSFYGMIDILSTYPFYLNFFVKIPYTALKALRIARLLRIFRYMKAFSILKRAIIAKKQEMVVSLQFLCIVTLILSFILFFVEHEVQPEVYNNGWKSVVWAFAQYIGDPGGFAETPPISLVGRLIACVIGILGIAIFAVPAGLIGSAFTEVMDADREEEEIKGYINRIVHSFKFVKDQQHTNLFCVPRYHAIETVVTRKFIPQADIIKAVEASDCLHLCNLAMSVHRQDNPDDSIVIVNYFKNRPYGCCIDRGSKVTIVFTSGYTEPLTGWFAYHIAKLGGFNYVSKEIEVDPDNQVTYYNIENEDDCPNMKLFLDDIRQFAEREGSWVIPILEATGPKSRPHQIHFCYNTRKKDESYDDPDALISDYEAFDKAYTRMEEVMDQKFNYKCDKNYWYGIQKGKNIGYHVNAANCFTLRVEAYLWIFNSGYVDVAKTIADVFNEAFEPEVRKVLPPEMVERRKGHDFGFSDYIN